MSGPRACTSLSSACGTGRSLGAPVLPSASGKLRVDAERELLLQNLLYDLLPEFAQLCEREIRRDLLALIERWRNVARDTHLRAGEALSSLIIWLTGKETERCADGPLGRRAEAAPFTHRATRSDSGVNDPAHAYIHPTRWSAGGPGGVLILPRRRADRRARRTGHRQVRGGGQAVSQEAWLGGSSSARCCAVSGPPLLCSSAAISSSIALRPRS